MSDILGLFQFTGDVDERGFKSSLDKLNNWNADNCAMWADGNIAFGHLKLLTTSELSDERLPRYDSDKKMAITCDARIDNGDELAAKLGLPLKESTDSDLILEGYKRWGKSCVNHFIGDFSFAIWDEVEQELFCARDHIGIAPFYYCNNSLMFSFSSQLMGAKGFLIKDNSIDELFLYTSLTRGGVSDEKTIYENVKSLPPGHSITVKSNGIEVEQYWKPEISDVLTSDRTESDYIEELSALLKTAVECRIINVNNVGSELSGGIDSGGITALAQQVLIGNNKNLQTFSQLKPISVKSVIDEQKEIEQILDYLKIKESTFCRGESSLTDFLTKALEFYQEPRASFYSLFGDELFQAVQNKGVNVLLSGLGGDEAISSHVSGFSEIMIKNKEWSWLWRELRAEKKGNGRPTLFRFGRLLFNEIGGGLNQSYLKGENTRRAGEEYLQKDFIKAVNNDLIPTYGDSGTPNQRVVNRLSRPYLNRRIQEGRCIGHQFKFEYRYPLLDVRLIEFYFRLPLKFKIKNGVSRYAYRQSLKGFLPDDILNRAIKNVPAIPSASSREKKVREFLFHQVENIHKESMAHKYIDVNKIDINSVDFEDNLRIFYLLFNILLLDRIGAGLQKTR